MNPVPSAELLDLKAQLEEWRHTHRKRARIPEHFYHAAVSLLDRHSVSLICKETGLRAASLRKHAGQSPSPAPASSSPAFLRLTPAELAPPRPRPTLPAEPAASAPACRLLFERADGSRHTLSLASADWTRIEALCQSFLRDR